MKTMTELLTAMNDCLTPMTIDSPPQLDTNLVDELLDEDDFEMMLQCLQSVPPDILVYRGKYHSIEYKPTADGLNYVAIMRDQDGNIHSIFDDEGNPVNTKEF